MYQGRTKSGLPIRSTIGMRVKNKASTWFLVANRSRLQLFERTKNERGPSIELRREIENPEGRKKGHELVSDQPGRSFDRHTINRHGQTGGPRHSYGGASQPEDQVTQKFARRAVDLFNDEGFNRDGLHLFVFADPSLTGKLRPALERKLPRAELVFNQKDFAWLDATEVKARLVEFIP